MTTHKTLHPRNDINKDYTSRKERGRGFASIKDCVEATIQGIYKKEQRKTRNSNRKIRTHSKITKY